MTDWEMVSRFNPGGKHSRPARRLVPVCIQHPMTSQIDSPHKNRHSTRALKLATGDAGVGIPSPSLAVAAAVTGISGTLFVAPRTAILHFARRRNIATMYLEFPSD